MSIQSEINRIAANVDDALAAVAEKGVTVSEDANSDDLGTLIRAIPAGGTAPVAVSPKEVNFYDYDGTCLYAYTVAEARALTELPPLPTPPKDFLQFEEWNWTLAQIKEYNDCVEVGAVYKPVDNKTRAVIQIDEDWQKNVTIRYCQWCANITVDWGDGSAAETTVKGGGTNYTATHAYAVKGTYTITIADAGAWNVGHNTETSPFFGDVSIGNGATALRELYFGSNVRPVMWCLYKAKKLKYLTTPKGQTQTWAYVARYCTSLKALIFPSTFTTINPDGFVLAKTMTVCSLPPSVTTISTRAFQSSGVLRLTVPSSAKTVSLAATNLEFVVLKEGVTALGEQCFHDAEKLTEVTIPQTVATIGSQCFSGCVSMLRLRFLPTTPPTVANANAFSGIPTNCVVEVPAGSLAAYKAATNYASIAAQMVEAGNGGNEYTEVLIEGTEHMELTTGDWEDVPYASVSGEISIDQTTGAITLDTPLSNVSLYELLHGNSESEDFGYTNVYLGPDLYFDLSDCNVILEDGSPRVSDIIKLYNGALWNCDMALSVYFEPGTYAWVTAEKGV